MEMHGIPREEVLDILGKRVVDVQDGTYLSPGSHGYIYWYTK